MERVFLTISYLYGEPTFRVNVYKLSGILIKSFIGKESINKVIDYCEESNFSIINLKEVKEGMDNV